MVPCHLLENTVEKYARVGVVAVVAVVVVGVVVVVGGGINIYKCAVYFGKNH